MKMAFMGSDPIALPMLQYLHSERCPDVQLAMVFTQPDRPTGRGMHRQANAIKRWAQETGLPVFQPAKCGREDAETLQRNQIDFVLVMAYGQILPRILLEACPLGTFNIHGSLLPRLRGASPIHTSIALGLKETGISFMRVIPKLDSGPVAAQERVAIAPDEATPSLIDKMARSCVPLMEKSLPKLVAGQLAFKTQDPDQVTYCRIIDKMDAFLDFNFPARELVDRVRAFQPWPGTMFPHNGQDLKILAAEVVPVSDDTPGRLLQDQEGSLCIACGSDALKPLRMQRPGGQALEAEDFLRGYPMETGTVLESREMRILEQKSPFPYRKKSIPGA